MPRDITFASSKKIRANSSTNSCRRLDPKNRRQFQILLRQLNRSDIRINLTHLRLLHSGTYSAPATTGDDMEDMENIHTMAKEDLVEDVRAIYGDATADQIQGTSAATLVEIVVVDHYGHEHLLDPIAKVK
jgi:L-arabinose isomerase